jgi:S-DNA-T family DNA segregation ATPase FtsK/SpoIIIE
MDDDAAGADGQDPKFYEALRIAVDNNRISTSLLQRMLSIGYGRAAKIIDEMERMGFVGPAVGNKPREIRITKQAYAELIMNKED